MGHLYVLGARQRKLLFKQEEEYHLYEAALILRVDTEAITADVCVEYTSPHEARTEEQPSHIFKSGTLDGDTLYACTSTEVLTYRLPGFERMEYISLPCFNDLHHVTPTRDGNLLVANTGLDMVVKFSPQGKVLQEWNVLGEPLWSRFSRDVDYRKVASTKPHRSHPNFVFELEGEVWATRFRQRDAICLTQPTKTIAVAVQTPHDGLPYQGAVYFTTVDGHLVIAGQSDLLVKHVVNLNEIGNPQGVLLGWCRGVLPVNDHQAWVGFTRVRKTRFKENVLWVKHAFREKERPTHLALYDWKNRHLLQEIDLEQFGMNVVFGIYPAAAPRQNGPWVQRAQQVETSV